jgi:hypothetical protein
MRPAAHAIPASPKTMLVSPAQLFVLVCVMKPENCGTTLAPLHVGHFGSVFSRAELVMVSSNGFLQVSHTRSVASVLLPFPVLPLCLRP